MKNKDEEASGNHKIDAFQFNTIDRTHSLTNIKDYQAKLQYDVSEILQSEPVSPMGEQVSSHPTFAPQGHVMQTTNHL